MRKIGDLLDGVLSAVEEHASGYVWSVSVSSSLSDTVVLVLLTDPRSDDCRKEELLFWLTEWESVPRDFEAEHLGMAVSTAVSRLREDT